MDNGLFRAILSCAVPHNIYQQWRLLMLDLFQEEEAGNNEPRYKGWDEGFGTGIGPRILF